MIPNQNLSPKQFFHFPELLLLITIVVVPISVGDSTINIITSDTIFVFGGNNLYNDSFSAYVDTILLFSWLSHFVLRKYSLMHKFLRWVQVILSIIAIMTLTIASLWLYPDSHNNPLTPSDYSRFLRSDSSLFQMGE